MADYLIGIDVGTSSAKAILADTAGKVVFSTAPEYRFETPRPQWAEANPEDWWEAVVKAIRQILAQSEASPGQIAGVGLTGQMHGLVLLDEAGRVLRPCILWNDQRTGEQCERLTAAVGAERALELTGNPILAGFTAPKLLWVKENEPEVFGRAAKALLPKDYIRYRLSGAFAGDVSDASGTSLLNLRERRWSSEMLEACGVPEAWMPELSESTEVSASVSREAAEATGLREGTPIVAGAGDQAAQAVGCGVVREGEMSATLGTSGVVFAPSDTCRVDPHGRLHAFCAASPGKWHLMGVMLSAAGSLQWFKQTFAGEEAAIEMTTGMDTYEQLTTAAAEAPPGSEGCLFLPYLSGERTPHPDPNATGVFFGLSRRHGKPHLIRSVLEGVTYGLRDSLELMRELGMDSEKVIASGGGATSTLWRQIMADVFETPIASVNADEGAAFGAALLAGVGAGAFDSLENACDSALKETSRMEPNPLYSAIYNEYFPHYRALYPSLRDNFERLSATVAKLTDKAPGASR